MGVVLAMRRWMSRRMSVVLLLAPVLLASCGSTTRVLGNGDTEPTSASSTTLEQVPVTMSASRSVLPPATVPPVSDECSVPLTKTADGNATPLLCPTGGVNVAAWNRLARGFVDRGPLTWSQTMALGYGATPAQAGRLFCRAYSAHASV